MLKDIRIKTDEGNNTILNMKEMLETINRRIEYLYDREHTIGHAYFTKLKEEATVKALAEIFEGKVIPLLQEYFYEDYEKIRLVLGDNAKSDGQYTFIMEQPMNRDVFRGNPDIDMDEKSYTINQDALNNIQSYIQIYTDSAEKTTKGNDDEEGGTGNQGV